MKIDVTSLRGREAHQAALDELVIRVQELEAEANGQPFTEAQQAEWEENREGRGYLEAAIEQLKIREAEVATAIRRGDRAVEGPASYSAPNVIRTPDNLFDMSAYRQSVGGDVTRLAGAYRDGAMRVIERLSFPMGNAEAHRSRLAEVVDKFKDDDHGRVSQRVIATSDPVYAEAFGQYVRAGMAGVTSGRLQAALQTYTDADGGYAVPVSIDPTFILTTDGNVNSVRGMARVETITTKSWSPVTTGGVTAAYAATEVTAAADGAPTDVGQARGGAITPHRAHVFVPFTAEYQEDYGPAAIQAAVGVLIRDAKDILEATKLLTGTGTNEPWGILAALKAAPAASIVDSITANTYALGDIDGLVGVLGDRFIGRAQFLAARLIYQTSRGFGTAGQPAGSIYDAMSKELRGYPAQVSNTMDKTTVTGKYPLLFGDFQHYVIVDRLGLAVEFVPQVFDGSGNPLGQRGIYARWRNSADVTTVNAFRLLHIK